MNAITTTEAQAIASTALQIAVPSKNMLLVPLSRLRPSRLNVRTTPATAIEAMASSIERIGLLQNLSVTLAADGVNYEVVAGGRRLAALKLLAKKKRIAKDWDVPCLQVADDSARTVSLTENVQREAMHPADQYEAFAALKAEGRPVEDIAADFGVTPLVVQRRLKLANVSPRLIADYRADTVTLDQLMALAVTDDHAAQEAAFYDSPQWQRSPSALREHLTAQEMKASHAWVRFVGLEAYEQAGGGVRRDLFAEGDDGIYVSDKAVLETLVREKLEASAAALRAEGWSWVDVAPAATFTDMHAFHRAPREQRPATKKEAERIEALEAQIQEIGEAVDAAMDADDEAKADELQEDGDRLGNELQALEESLLEFSDSIKSVGGCVVTVDRSGEVALHRGLLKEEDHKALRAQESTRGGSALDTGAGGQDGGADEAQTTAGMTDKLAQRLSAHRTAALQIEVAQHPHVALTSVVHVLVQTTLHRGYQRSLPMGVRITEQNGLETLAPDLPESPAAVALREVRQSWGDKLPSDSDELFAALLAMTQDELVRLLAVCTATAVDVVTHRHTPSQPGEQLAQATGLNMATWWKPTAEGYFTHLSKAMIQNAVSEFAPAEVERLGKLKKAEIAAEAERLVEGTGWMPAIFAIKPVQDATEQGDAAEPRPGAEPSDASTTDKDVE